MNQLVPLEPPPQDLLLEECVRVPSFGTQEEEPTYEVDTPQTATDPVSTLLITCQWRCVQHVPLPDRFYKDDCSKATISLVFGFVECSTGRVPTVEEYLYFHVEVKLLRALDMTEIKDDILSIKSKTLCANTNTVHLELRINNVSRNYRSPFVLHVYPAKTSLSWGFMPFNTNAIEVRSKTPISCVTPAPNAKKRKRKSTKQPVWVLPWSKSCYQLLQELQWSVTDGFRVVGGVVDTNAPIRRCPSCYGFQEQGHRPKCELVHLLKSSKFSTTHNETVLLS